MKTCSAFMIGALFGLYHFATADDNFHSVAPDGSRLNKTLVPPTYTPAQNMPGPGVRLMQGAGGAAGRSGRPLHNSGLNSWNTFPSLFEPGFALSGSRGAAPDSFDKRPVVKTP